MLFFALKSFLYLDFGCVMKKKFKWGQNDWTKIKIPEFLLYGKSWK